MTPRGRLGAPSAMRGWGRLAGFVVFGALLGAQPACVDWLEVDEDEEAELATEARRALRAEAPPLPSRGAEPGADGPIVPRTPGLRVPADAGYWARMRLETLDVVLPYALVSFTRVDGTLFMRFEAIHDEGLVERSLRGVIGLKLPLSAAIDDLAGADIKPELADTTAVFRTSGKDTWILAPSRLTFELLGHDVVVGSFEGIATRGLDGRRQRAFEVGFIALRGPDATTGQATDEQDSLTP